MNRTRIMFAAAILAGSAFAQQKGAPADMAADLQQSYTGGKTKIIAAAEEMPEAGYALKPTPDVRTFAGWVGHLVDTNAQFCQVITGGTKTFGAETGMTAKADLVAALKQSFEICDAAYTGTTMANRDEVVQTFRGGRPRASWLYFNVAHNEEGYGSMAVYLRLQKLVPPSSAGRGGAAKGKGKQ